MHRRMFTCGLGLGSWLLGHQALAQAVLRPVIPTGLVGSFAESWLERERLLQAIDQSLSYFGRASSQRDYPQADLPHWAMQGALKFFKDQLIQSTTPLEFELRVWHYFNFYQAAGQKGQGDVLFTGYYEPVFEGSMRPNERFRFPLYRLPTDLVLDRQGKAKGRRTSQGFVPYYTRAEIEEQQLLKGLELAWLDNPFDAYLIHVQGSARLVLEDGQVMGIGYAGKTDRPYQSLGKALIKQGVFKPEEVTLPVLRQYFQDHPDRLKPLLYTNESYVFFQQTPLYATGPKGSIGVPLTARYSIATDRKIFPRGALALVDVALPEVDGVRPWRRFVCNQDTGGAIIGPGRVDLYIGTGPAAEQVAGRLKSVGNLYFPVLKPDPPPFGS